TLILLRKVTKIFFDWLDLVVSIAMKDCLILSDGWLIIQFWLFELRVEFIGVDKLGRRKVDRELDQLLTG
ncbi:MAG: hypothetical protein VX917_07640, partial [Chloroflexota bacterium]|nr:hypothetical protein [Chloroflexota bacterium]